MFRGHIACTGCQCTMAITLSVRRSTAFNTVRLGGQEQRIGLIQI
jgi:hypothetical protein